MDNFQDLNKSDENVNYPKEIQKVTREINRYAFGFIDRLGNAYKNNKQGFEEHANLIEKRRSLESALKEVPSEEKDVREFLVNRITAVKKDISELSRDSVLIPSRVERIELILSKSKELKDELEKLYTDSYNW